MNKEEFEIFKSANDLFFFNTLIGINLANGYKQRAVWITGLPSLGKSADGNFPGKSEVDIFYLFDSGKYEAINIDSIESIEILESNYLEN